MDDALGHDIPVPRLQVNGLLFEINDEVPIQDKEELVIFICLCSDTRPALRPGG